MMPERLSEQRLAEMERWVAAYERGHAWITGGLPRHVATIRELLAEIHRLRAIEAAARAVLEHVAHPEEGYEELMALMEAMGT